MPRREHQPLPPLAPEQSDASRPDQHVGLSASAGTGKTQVLTARVLRLLLNGVDPEAILCLTFTKSGAAEMKERIHERLGAWVTMKDTELAHDLKHLHEAYGPDEQDHARTLFARLLDARGSGLRIQTIHSFCQSLLAGFPAEAGLAPAFRAIEGRDEEQLAAQTLAHLIATWEREGRVGDLDRFRRTSLNLGEETMRGLLRRCAQNPEWIDHVPAGEGLFPFVNRALSGGTDDIQAHLIKIFEEGADAVLMEQLSEIYSGWRKKDGGLYSQAEKVLDFIGQWRTSTPTQRFELLSSIHFIWHDSKGDARKTRPDHPLHDRIVDGLKGYRELKLCGDFAPKIADALGVARDYARNYAVAKRNAGVVDFNDLIRITARLLQTPGIGEWIAYKLDQTIDHVLVDESQDTNEAQWEIVRALTGDFFSGIGVKGKQGETLRTIFTVGDFKQAIFGFQGTNPRAYEGATSHFREQAEQSEQDYFGLALKQSFRSSQPILDVTDQVIVQLGHEKFGLPQAPGPHPSFVKGSGRVELLAPISSVNGADEEEETEEGWFSTSELIWADELAQKIKHWTNGGLRLRNKGRDAEPGDVMILLRSRTDLARLIVSRLHKRQVPVAGVDRLRLGAPIAVQDLLACIRFALQPQDDLSLACILVSPLMGWSQDDLYQAAKLRNVSLWRHLNATQDSGALLTPTLLLNQADRMTPHQYLEWILSGPICGRKKLIGRLGEEARDPIEELLNQALAFERQNVPTLQGFLDWFERGTVEVKRDPDKPENAVRVMTVHAAKGLQAPIVVLADATADPDFKKSRDLDWVIDEVSIPLFRPGGAKGVRALAESISVQDQRDAEEHWRLLYVAMTRAEEHLIVGGALRPRQEGKELGARCWHQQIRRALFAMGAVEAFGGLLLDRPEKEKPNKKEHEAIEFWLGELPNWLHEMAPREAKPPRPLTPSAILPVDLEADAPPSEVFRAAAQRGVLLHSLFERLPDVSPEARADVANRWLERSAGVADTIEREKLIDDALKIIENGAYSEIFSEHSLAETPLAGVVEGQTIAGTVDRLLITESEVTVVDFKTGRRVPDSPLAVSSHHKAQMSAYVEVLKQVFPGKSVRAALLYTSGPSLIELPRDMLYAYKPGFSAAEQVLA